MKVYITKYALTAGILEKEVESCDGVSGMVSVIGVPHEYYHGEGKDWHRTRETAIERAEVMRSHKIISLEKQIRKLREIDFLEPKQ